MKILTSSIAFVAITTNMAMAGGSNLAPIEPTTNVPQKEVIVVNDNVKYDGFYLGGALSYLRMNEVVETRGQALTLAGGYYFNKYLGIEARYTRTLTDIDEDQGAETVSKGNVLSNMGVYVKPMYNITTGFSAYGLAGYGLAKYDKESEDESLQESGLQWGIGTKYELANGVGFFFDYMSFYDGDDFDTLEAQGVFFNSTSVGATYTF